jgi:hypothetical protein
MLKDLVRWSFSGPRVDLNAEANRVMGGGMPRGEMPKSPTAPSPAGMAAVPQVVVNSAPIYITATSYQAIRPQVLADVDARMSQAFSYLNNQAKMRGGQ